MYLPREWRPAIVADSHTRRRRRRSLVSTRIIAVLTSWLSYRTISDRSLTRDDPAFNITGSRGELAYSYHFFRPTINFVANVSPVMLCQGRRLAICKCISREKRASRSSKLVFLREKKWKNREGEGKRIGEGNAMLKGLSNVLKCLGTVSRWLWLLRIRRREGWLRCWHELLFFECLDCRVVVVIMVIREVFEMGLRLELLGKLSFRRYCYNEKVLFNGI